MTQPLANDPLAKIWGLVPRYMRERQAAEALEMAREAAMPRPAPVAQEVFQARAVDAVTADLRRRIAFVEPPRRARLAMAAPAFAGVALVFGALLSH